MMIFWITPILHEEALKHPQDVHQVQLKRVYGGPGFPIKLV